MLPYGYTVDELIEAVLLGVVQGLTEFLPVSSTGHLVLTQSILGVSEDQFGLRFDAAIHLGTLAAVVFYFRVLVGNLAVAWLRSLKARDWQHTRDARLAWLLGIGTIPAGIAGLALGAVIEDTFRSPTLVAVMLIAFCAPMLLAERVGCRVRDLSSAGVRDALLVGFAQAVALVPGVSRSGITISAGMFAGFKRDEAAVFAFLLSAPIIAAAGGVGVLRVLTGTDEGAAPSLGVYAAGVLSATVVGYAAVAFLLRYLRGNPLHAFVVYRVALGITVLGLVAGGVL